MIAHHHHVCFPTKNCGVFSMEAHLLDNLDPHASASKVAQCSTPMTNDWSHPYLNPSPTQSPGPRIVPSCHPGWGAVSDLGGSFAERGFKMGHRHSGTTTRAKTAPFQLSFHTLIFRCFVLIPSLCLLSASFCSLC